MQRKIQASVIIALSILTGHTVLAQKTFTMNSEGNVCYFWYTCYAPNNDYENLKRPFIFVIGNENETALQSYERDATKDLPQFYNYMFVYIPNRGKSGLEKLKCIESLASTATYHYAYGKTNLFFQVNDTTLKQSDIELAGLYQTFQTVRLAEKTDSTGRVTQNNTVSEDFRENTTAYGAAIESEDDKYGTFYIEEEEKGNATPYLKARKTYFGPPQSFDFTLTGVIKDRSTGEALPFASIQIRKPVIDVSSNADGYYTIQNVPTDTTTLTIQYVGYEKTDVFLTPMINKKYFVIELNPSAQTLQTASIVTSRTDIVLSKKEDVSVIKLTPKKLEQLPNLGERDVMRSFQLMPGVSASNESSSGLYVRGGTPDQNLVLYDGFTVYHVDHLYGFFSAFNSNALKDVQLYKGGFESRFGGRLSSVTEITGKDGNRNKFNVLCYQI